MWQNTIFLQNTEHIHTHFPIFSQSTNQIVNLLSYTKSIGLCYVVLEIYENKELTNLVTVQEKIILYHKKTIDMDPQKDMYSMSTVPYTRV